MELLQIALVLLVLLSVLLAGGVWIAVALMACGWVGMQYVGGNIPAGPVLATTIWGNSASWTLAALPLFIWMGEILFRTKLSEEMFRGLAPWLNWLPGRLMHVNVLACGIFGSVSGSSAATCATVAKIALPELKKRGYDEMVSLGSLAGAGTLGILIPPSITMVVYEPGDIVFTGTPSGVGHARKPNPVWMKPGDVCEIEVERVGILRNPIVAEA